MEIRKIDWYLMFCFLFIFVSIIFFATYYYVYHVDACYADPLEYYVQKIEWEYGGAFKVYGNVNLMSGNVVHALSFGENGRNMTTEIREEEKIEEEYRSINLSNYFIKN